MDYLFQFFVNLTEWDTSGNEKYFKWFQLYASQIQISPGPWQQSLMCEMG